ncbi:guanine nucleotide exchange protein SMCR8 [Protopterus annectens]|uniref:guanine nucleotide exchange protein SMCR8 n=1 Tax=Protopterus annectens TaxID=7888 RepID=UPI001CFB0DE3|nr:guanine nucleotide exchange protein SMCR8 [Protopterus annectens]
MIGAPDVVAFTKEEEYDNGYDNFIPLPEEYSVPLSPFSSDANPWTKSYNAKFVKDFILISEFSEQVGPQPLLTFPDDPKVCGSFDLNYFSLRIMSVDYQASFVGHPPGSAYPKLNFVEDSQVVLGDSKEGAFAYVHHLTLYDLEARGFVRPFCMAYISTDEQKIMQQFQELASEFSKVSELLKSGNRKAFANELEKKLKDLNYTRTVLHKETEIQKRTNDRGYYTTQAIEKANELANVEKSIIEHQDLLKQIRTYPGRKLANAGLSLDSLNIVEQVSTSLDQVSDTADTEEQPEINNCTRRLSYTPQFIKAKSAKCFDKKLKTLEELCDVYYFNQTIDHLTRLERMFREDLCYLLMTPIDGSLLKQQKITSFLFADIGLIEDECREQQHSSDKMPHSQDNFALKTVEETCSPELSTSLEESYSSSVGYLPIKLDQEVPDVPHENEMSALCVSDHLGSSQYLNPDTRGSVSSGESIEVIGSEKSTLPLSKSESQPSLQIHYPDVRKKAVNRTNSEDSIEVLISAESLLRSDIRVSHHGAIDEEPYVNDDLQFECSSTVQQEDEGGIEYYYENEQMPEDSTCCIGKESPNVHFSAVDQECFDSVVSVPPQPYKQTEQGAFTCASEDGQHSTGILSTGEPTHLSVNGDASRADMEESFDSTSYISSASKSSDCTPLCANSCSQVSGKKKRKVGKIALNFIRQYSFAQPAIFSLLSGRTLVVVGEVEKTVKKLVTGLSIFVPKFIDYPKLVKHWVAPPLHITDFQHWKLIGLQRLVSPVGKKLFYSLNRYSRYISILDADSKTLHCPIYKGDLLSHLANHRTQIKRGDTYIMHVETMLAQLTSKVFLYTFCHHLHVPIRVNEPETSIACRQKKFLMELLGSENDDARIVQYLSELIKMHYIQGPMRGVTPALRFDYVPSFLYKI